MLKQQELQNENISREEERELIRQAKQGFQPAFSQLIQEHQKMVFRMAYAFFRDREDALEIVQETFLRLFRKIHNFDENDENNRFQSWIYRVAANICIDYYRKYKKQKASMKEIYQQDIEGRSTDPGPEVQIARNQFQKNLEQSVFNLPKQQKTIFVLKHYNGLKHHEISSMLNLSVGTIKSLYHRAIQNIKKKLLKEDHGMRWQNE